MALLNADELKRVNEAVARAELDTAGEIVVVTMRRADDYAAPRALGALGLTVLLASEALVQLPGLPGWGLLLGQIPVALGAYTLLGLGPVLRLLLPKKRLAQAVDARAQQAFVEFGLTETRDRSGVLLLVSEAEHRVRLLADKGIHERVAPDHWQKHVDELVGAIRAGQTGSGLVHAVEQLGTTLAEFFPPRSDDTNELPDEVREL